ncbi:MAG: nuclear transport factor 2 family protein [Saprospiraceae bacterium]|nr:nuclear transport factor 2 family protein [Saprospiraceae bacterium]
MKKQTVFFILFLQFNLLYAQNLKPEEASILFNQALINRDTKILEKLTDDKLSYGHSNAWIEDKESLLKNNLTGYLIYKSIEVENLSRNNKKNICTIRYDGNFEVLLNNKEIKLKIHVLQVWIKKNGAWKLFARQSTKMS